MPITRLSVDGYGARRAGSFANKVGTVVVAAPVVKRKDSSGGKKKKRDFFIQDALYEQRIAAKKSVEIQDSVHPPVKPEKVKPGQIKPAVKIKDIKPAISQIVTDEDIELVMMVLDAIDEAA